MKGKLLLLPNLLDESLSHELYLPAGLQGVVSTLKGLICESEKGGRRFLRRFLSHDQMAALPLQLLNEHTTSLEPLLAPLLKGEGWGLISDAGLPCIADPGSDLVRLAHEKGISVETFAGPSSILMSLQLSGFSGQQFSFHGYLPREAADLEAKLLELERRTKEGTQIWIEAPYRSAKMLEMLLRALKEETRLCLAVNLTMPSQRVLTAAVAKWRAHPFPLAKEPAVFLIGR